MMSLYNMARLGLLNMGILKLNEDSNMKMSYLYYEPVDKDQFLRICRERKMFPILYKQEFELACKHGEISSAAAASHDHSKNRNQNILPYDHNRVILEPSEEYPSDYINASYVKSLIVPVQYIVTQGPLESTVDDFYRLVWQEKVSCIIMLTKCFDFTKKMCYQYWSSHGPGHIESCGGLDIQSLSTEVLANYTIRHFKIWKSDAKEEVRELVHFHFTEWPCYTEPFIPALLDFRRRVRQIVTGSLGLAKGKTLVHCNNGTGRSGTYLAIDANLEFLDKKGKCDVFGYVAKLRKSRNGLVETEEQVKYIYNALEEYILCGHTSFSVSDLSLQMKRKSGQDRSKNNEFQQEFQLICRLTPKYTTGDCAGSYRAENRLKNRDISVIAPDNFRPYLTSYQGTLDTDFINAVFVDRYREAKGLIVTEWPQAATISLFWSLIYDFDVSSIVVLAEPDSPVEYPVFWPHDSRSEMYGPVFTVKQLGRNHSSSNVRSWIFEINKKIISLTDLMTGVKAEPKKCQLFQLTDWPMNQKTPSSPASLVDLVVTVDHWNKRRSGEGPTVVLSHDGRSRVGLYCGVVTTVEQILTHGEIDLFTTIRMLRRYRPRIMPSQSEYRFCYNVVQHYVQQNKQL